MSIFLALILEVCNYEIAQNICPEGWHLPEQTEWENLKEYAINSENLRQSSEWHHIYDFRATGGIFYIGRSRIPDFSNSVIETLWWKQFFYFENAYLTSVWTEIDNNLYIK